MSKKGKPIRPFRVQGKQAQGSPRRFTLKGKLVVFEGTDGTGKTTQSKLLVAYLNNPPTGGKISAEYISFPRYEDSMWAQMVKRYLLGEFGTLAQVDPYFVSMLYAGDRMAAAVTLKKWLNAGKIIVCNRYIGSNIAHMGAKLKGQNEKSKYIEWLEKLEYGENKIPREDLVILLSVPIAVTEKLMGARRLDIHEKNSRYLKDVFDVYSFVAKRRNNWEVVDCTQDGKILSPQIIHKKVLEVLIRRKILNV